LSGKLKTSREKIQNIHMLYYIVRGVSEKLTKGLFGRASAKVKITFVVASPMEQIYLGSRLSFW
jgi:hypothetical protein